MSKKNALSKIPSVEYLEVERKALEAKVGELPPEDGSLLLSVWGFIRQDFRSAWASIFFFGGAALAATGSLIILASLYFGVGAGVIMPEIIGLLLLSGSAMASGHQVEKRARLAFRSQRQLAAKRENPLLTPQHVIAELEQEKKKLADGPGNFFRLHEAATQAHTKVTEALKKLRERSASQESLAYLTEATDLAEQQVNRRMSDVHKLERRQTEIKAVLNRMITQANELLQKFGDLEVMKSLAELSEEVRQMLPERETEVSHEAQEIYDALKELRGTLDAHWRASEAEVALGSISQGGTPEDYQDLSAAISLFASFKLSE